MSYHFTHDDVIEMLRAVSDLSGPSVPAGDPEGRMTQLLGVIGGLVRSDAVSANVVELSAPTRDSLKCGGWGAGDGGEPLLYTCHPYGPSDLLLVFTRGAGSPAFTLRDLAVIGALVAAFGPIKSGERNGHQLGDPPGCRVAGVRLSPRQIEVLELLRSGQAEKEVARRLKLSINTVHTHAKEIYRRYGVHSRVELLCRVRPVSQAEPVAPALPAGRAWRVTLPGCRPTREATASQLIARWLC